MASNEIGYSLKQVYAAMLTIKPDLTTWDDIVDAVISLRVLLTTFERKEIIRVGESHNESM